MVYSIRSYPLLHVPQLFHRPQARLWPQIGGINFRNSITGAPVQRSVEEDDRLMPVNPASVHERSRQPSFTDSVTVLIFGHIVQTWGCFPFLRGKGILWMPSDALGGFSFGLPNMALPDVHTP